MPEYFFSKLAAIYETGNLSYSKEILTYRHLDPCMYMYIHIGVKNKEGAVRFIQSQKFVIL